MTVEIVGGPHDGALFAVPDHSTCVTVCRPNIGPTAYSNEHDAQGPTSEIAICAIVRPDADGPLKAIWPWP